MVGRRICDLRKAKGETLNAVAAATGLSIGYLSQIERELAAPSVRALSVVARFLGVNISWFFPDPAPSDDAEASVIVRAAKRPSLKFESGVRDELLCPTLSGKLEMLRCTFAPGASSGEPYAHDGEEAGFVVEGRLQLLIDDAVYDLDEGDSFHFECRRPHSYRNPHDRRAVIIWSVTPPHY